MTTAPHLYVGSILYGFCGGYFGPDDYVDKRVEAIGADWVVARTVASGVPVFADVRPDELLEYTSPEDEFGKRQPDSTTHERQD